jgi:hypothetical protein
MSVQFNPSTAYSQVQDQTLTTRQNEEEILDESSDDGQPTEHEMELLDQHINAVLERRDLIDLSRYRFSQEPDESLKGNP